LTLDATNAGKHLFLVFRGVRQSRLQMNGL
jgi:hypothetical protein